MIVRENKMINDKEFVYTYSDAGFKIQRNNHIFNSAYDPVEFAESRIYTETDIPIVTEE